MLGGLLAYFVMSLREGGDFLRLKAEIDQKLRTPNSRWGVILRNMLSAGLLSGVVTIVLSRISDTQFPIKVSVADFWGALTVGFVAYFAGNKLIDKIAGAASTGNAPTPGQPATKPSPVTQTPPAEQAPKTAKAADGIGEPAISATAVTKPSSRAGASGAQATG
jgi:hypothetical protein